MPVSSQTKKIIFNKVKKALCSCSPPMVANIDSENSYSLIGNKPVPYGYKKEIIPGMFFASALIRKNSVVFYFFPSYNNPSFKKTAPSLYKFLKGKTCFHFKKEEDVNEKELSSLLKSGMKEWEKVGYMKEKAP